MMVFWAGSLLMLLAVFLVFRVFILREYRNKGTLSPRSIVGNTSFCIACEFALPVPPGEVAGVSASPNQPCPQLDIPGHYLSGCYVFPGLYGILRI